MNKLKVIRRLEIAAGGKGVPTQVFGHLWFKNGKEIELDGSSPFRLRVVPKDIISFGQHSLGNKANVTVVWSTGKTTVLNTMDAIKDFFENLGRD